MKKLLMAAAAAAALSLVGAGMAQASTFFLTLSDPTAGLTGSPYGQVDVTGEGTQTMGITVSLYGTNEFHWANDANHHALVFDLVGNPGVTISGLPASFTANGAQAAGSDSSTPFGTFDYVINFPQITGRNAPPMPIIHSFGFTVTSLSNLTLDSTHSSYGDVYFATDIKQPGTNLTGNVGALKTVTPPPPGVPEPASWAMMIVGFAGVGGLLRRSRRQGAVAAAA